MGVGGVARVPGGGIVMPRRRDRLGVRAPELREHHAEIFVREPLAASDAGLDAVAERAEPRAAVNRQLIAPAVTP